MSSDYPNPELPDDVVPPATLNTAIETASDEEEAIEPRHAREGLPRGFRMRHDAHFVDQLDDSSPSAVLRMLPLGGIDAPSCADGPAIEALARSIRTIGIVEPLVVRRNAGRYRVIAGAKRLSAARLAQLDRVPCIVRDDLAEDALGSVADVRVSAMSSLDERPRGLFSSTTRERVLDEAIASLAAARTSVDLTLPRSDRLRSRAGADLVRAELLNARLALMAMRLVSAPPLIRRTQECPRQLLDAVMAEVAPVLRLSNARVTVTAGGAIPDLVVTRPLVVFALEACISTVLTLAGDAPDPALTITLSRDAQNNAVICSTRLEGGWLPAETARRLGDMDWPAHPAGTSCAMVVAAAEAVAKLHDGTLDVATDYDGFGMSLTLKGR